MPGGLLQIAINSGKDNYLVSNPQISFFKSVYRKYTRFSIETIKETPNLTNLQEDTDTNINIKVPRNGDLLKRAYLTFDLPDIYSGYCELSAGAVTDLYKFKWIENIGYNIIKNTSLIIGDSTIDKLYGEYMYIDNELMKTKDEKEIIDELVGNVKELYEPENSMGQYNNNSMNSTYIQHKYPNIVNGNQYERFTQSFNYNNIWTQLGSDIDGEAVDDNSGNSVALSSDGTIVAIGTYYNDSAGTNSGQVRVYQYSGGSWSQLGSDIDGEAGGDQSGISVALSSDGTIVAIGANGNDGTGSNAGQVRVYQYSGGSWSQLGSDIDGEAADDESGWSVALSSDGSIVAIGAPINNSTTGHVRVYQYSGGSWSQLGSDIDGEAGGDQSGYSVALSSDGTIVAIGANGNDGTGSNAGHVRVYQYNGGSWSQLGSDIDGEAVDDESGYSVALSSDGTIVAIGAIGNNGTGSDAGHVRVYQYNGISWSQLGSDIDGESANDLSGISVALSSDGTIVAIGANGNDGTGSNAGHVRIYYYSSGSWTQIGSDIDGEASGDGSGYSVALSGDGSIVAIGAPYNNGAASDAGHVRVYNYPSFSTFIKIDEVALGTTFPSILGRKIKVPLDFWFSKNSGSALPLISLQYHEVRIEMVLRKINDLYTILDALNTSSSHDLRIKPSSSLEYTRIQNFLADTAYVNDTTAAVGSRSLKNFGINTEFEFDYIFLDEAERKRFALYEHEYLITQHHQKKTTTGIDTSNYDLDISGNHLIQYLAIIPKRDDMEKINKYNNYTNWLYSDIPPYSYDYTNSEMYYNIENSKHIFYSNDSGATHTGYFNKDYFKKNIITNMKLKFNGMDRTKVYDNIYYEKQHPLDYFKNKPKDGIYIYSFSLDPKNEQPTGACDFSNLSSVELECNFNQAPLTTYYKLNVDVYLVNYNILKIASGMGALEFA